MTQICTISNIKQRHLHRNLTNAFEICLPSLGLMVWGYGCWWSDLSRVQKKPRYRDANIRLRESQEFFWKSANKYVVDRVFFSSGFISTRIFTTLKSIVNNTCTALLSIYRWRTKQHSKAQNRPFSISPPSLGVQWICHRCPPGQFWRQPAHENSLILGF